MSDDPTQLPILEENAQEAPSASTSTTPAAVRPTQNGGVSKMRSHRGNVPTLPQTKFCHLCSAKFTRTTHLNRHLKTHSNERLHECERCHAQFTRSDLLTRHKRTCADSVTNRSRRKSCQSCAESKVKCDLQRPCSKCKARGRECIYAKASGSSPDIASSSQNNINGSSPETGVNATSSASSSNQDSPPDSTLSPQTSLSSATAGSSLSPSIDPLSDTSSSSVLISSSSPLDAAAGRLHSFDPSPLIASPDSQSPEKSYFTELFSSQMFDSLFTDLFMTSFQKNPTVPGHHFNQDPTSVLVDRLESAGIDQAVIDAFYGGHPQVAMYSNPSMIPAMPTDTLDNIPENEILEGTSQQTVAVHQEMPSVAEFYEYIMAFMTTFSWHMPIVHLPTFLQEPRHPALVKATKACGAMYSNTPAATNFINKVLSTVRDRIIADLSHTTDYDEIIQLTLGSAMIQTIGMFHSDPEQRAKSNVYHGMIVMMLRMNGFIDKTRDWKLPEIDFDDPISLQTSWREWVRHESAKRALWACYIQDCCHAIFFNLSPTLHTEQFTLGLPAEDALWTAKTATEWAAVLQQPSPYGTMQVRLCGHYLKALYYYLIQDNPGQDTRPFNITPFAHFIMIHAMMRKLFEFYLRDRLPLSQPETSGVRPKLNPHCVNKDRVFHVQILLHSWLQSWLQSPETPRDVPESQQRFCFNALPYYWIAQIGLVAYQEGLPPFDPEGTYITSHEAKFNLLKKWEKHVRKFLEKGGHSQTTFWDEVMKGRIENWQAESGFDFTNLQGFFNPQQM